MNIQGLQKLTLLDYPGRVACTVFTGGCNFRCPFCQNSGLVLPPGQPPTWEPDALLAFLKKRVGILDGVCLTGGEPLMQPDLSKLLRDIRRLGFAIKLDTNGSFPDRLRRLAEEGLIDYVAMDVKNSPERYRETAGLPADSDLGPIFKSIAWLLEGTVPYEFRTTVVFEYHQPQDIVSMARRLIGARQWFLQGFVSSEHVIKQGLHACGAAEMETLAQHARAFVPSVQIRGI
ncbi:MAG: anaerobic ribonucleoside-triphosphate reductase activating protein [Lachnospiraceae bacterium]|nr:anaerobic ribonucleoside-triphosphate reductase activating protein [Lachnospiraceae bacterium]